MAQQKVIKGTAHSKNVLYLAPAQRNLMHPILLAYEVPFRSNLQKKTLVQWGSYWSSEGHDPHWTSVFLLLNGASHYTKIGCIRLVWAGAKKFHFCSAQTV